MEKTPTPLTLELWVTRLISRVRVWLFGPDLFGDAPYTLVVPYSKKAHRRAAKILEKMKRDTIGKWPTGSRTTSTKPSRSGGALPVTSKRRRKGKARAVARAKRSRKGSRRRKSSKGTRS